MKTVLLFIILIFLSIALYLSFFSDNASPSFSLDNPQSKTAKTSVQKDNQKFTTLNIEKIFSLDHIEIQKIPNDQKVTIIATGDVIPARSVNYQAYARDNYKWSFEKTAQFLNQADLTFINLETPLLRDCPVTQEGMVFCGSSKHIEGLKYAGVDIASLANNHAGNWGEKGVFETVSLLQNNGIQTVGTTGSFLVKEIKGIKFAFLGFNDITSPQPGVDDVDEDIVCSNIKSARLSSDIVIVTYHWGAEYQNQPDDRQKYLGHFTIDCGADLVIGNHPHWVQPIEFYQDKLITYAHGNFVFDQEWSPETKLGVVGKYTFVEKQLVDVEYFPIRIIEYGQPYFLESEERQQVLDDMRQQSMILLN